MQMTGKLAVGLWALLLGIGGCAVEGEFPRLVDIPEAPAEATPMEEKRTIAEEMTERATADDEDVAETGE